MIKLTRRETDIYKLIVEGFSNLEIADKLFVSLRTIKSHVSNILMKYEVNSRARLIVQHYKTLGGSALATGFGHG